MLAGNCVDKYLLFVGTYLFFKFSNIRKYYCSELCQKNCNGDQTPVENQSLLRPWYKPMDKHLFSKYISFLEAQEQVTANLANFAYDPINWDYLKGAEAITLFLELLNSPNDCMQLHGSAGLCNICLDQQAFDFILKHQNIKVIKETLTKSKKLDVILNLLTLFYQLLSQTKSNKTEILCPAVLKQIKNYNSLYCKDKRILNITSLLLQDFGKRYEFIEATKNSSFNNPPVD